MNKCCFGFIAVLLLFDWARAATPGEPITQDELVRRTQELCDTTVTVDLCFAENRRRYQSIGLSSVRSLRGKSSVEFLSGDLKPDSRERL